MRRDADTVAQGGNATQYSREADNPRKAELLDVERLVRRVNARLAELLPAVLPGHDSLAQAVRQSVMGPGKRLRPVMTILVVQGLGGSTRAAVDAGCAVEMVHAASLLLDDLPCMDDALLRRGKPAIHRSHGEDVAILTSVALLSRAYGILASLPDVDPVVRAECVAVLAEAVGPLGLVGGQLGDLRTARTHAEQAVRINELKTGALFRAAVEIGALVADADDATCDHLRGFAREIGSTFQLLDDLLDLSGDPLSAGKDVGKDLGKGTVVSLVGASRPRTAINDHVVRAKHHLDAVFGHASPLAALVETVIRSVLGSYVPQDNACEPIGDLL